MLTIGNFWRRALLLSALTLLAACGTPTSEQLLASARAAAADGKPRTAQIHLKNLLQNDPDNGQARAMLGLVSLAMGDAAEAEHNLRAALDLGGDPTSLQLPLLQSLMQQRKFSEALAQIAAGPPLTGAAQVSVLNIKGTANQGLNRLVEAEADFQASLALDPSSAFGRTQLATVYFQTGRIQEARDLVAKVVAEHPSYVPALLQQGTMDAAAARYDDAQTVLRRVLEIEKQRPAGAAYGAALGQLAEIELARRDVGNAAAHADELLALHPQSAYAAYLKARVEVEQTDLNAAERRLEAVIANVPDYWPAYVLLGVINVSQKHMGQAEMYLRRAVNSNPKDARAQLLLAEVYANQNDIGGAREVIDKSAAATDGLFLALAGRASLEAGQPALAAEYFARSEQSPPRNLRELIDKSSVYIAAGQLDRALRVLQSASLNEPDSANVANYLLTVVQLRRGDLVAAQATARRLTEPAPESLNVRGTIALMSKNLPAARDLFEQALVRQPNYVPALLNLARTAVAQQDPSAAAGYLRRVVEVQPEQINAIYGLMQLAAGRRDFAEAETWLARAPESVLRMRLGGELRFAEGRYEDAVASFARAYELVPSVELALRSYAAASKAGHPDANALLLAWLAQHPNDVTANYALGTIALEKGDHDAAISSYQTVLRADPKHLGALNNLAWIYGERNDAQALELAQRAHEIQPNDPSTADTLGWLYVRQGAAAAGLPLLEQALRGYPSEPEIRYHVAVALAATGERAKAAELLGDLLAGRDNFRSREDAGKLLASLRSGTARR